WPLRRAPRALQSSADGRRLALLDAHVTAIFRLSLPSGQRWLLGAQPVGRRLLAALPAAHTLRFVGERALLLAGRDGKLSWFARPKAAPRPLGTASAATRIALDPAARRIVALDVTLDVTRDGAIDKANGAPELRLWQLAGPNGAPRALRPPRLRGPRCAARDVALASASTLLLGCEDGRLLAVPLDSAAAGGKHTKRAEQRVLTRHSTAARLLAVAPDGSRFASASDDGVRLGALPSGRLIAALPLEQPRALAFFPDGTLLAQTSSYSLSIDRDGVVRDGGTTSANAAPLAGKRLAITRGRRGGKPAVELVSSESAAQQRYGPRQGHAGAVRDIAVSADGTVIASVGDEPLLQLWGARGRALRRLPLPSAPTALCIARNRVLVGDRRGRVYAVSLDGRVDGDRALHQKRVTALACLAGDRVVSAGADGRVLLFEATKPQRAARTLLTARSAVLALAVSGGGQVAVAARDGSLTRFSLDAAGKTSAPRTVAARGKLTDTAISADGSFIAAIGPRELVIVSRDGRTHHRLEGSRGARIAFLPDDLANRGALMLVDAAGRRQRIDPTSARQRPPSKPDERWRLTRLVATAHALLGGGRDGTLRRWDWTLAALGRDDERPLEPSTLPRQVIVRNLHVSLHGDVLIARRGKRRARWPLGPGATCVAASPDGWIAVGMLDGSVELRHLTRTQLAPRLPAATTAVSALRFGRRDVLLVARRGGALSLWHVPTRARLYDARLHGTVVRIQSLPQQRGWRLRSELGDALVVDASPLSRSRCELLAEIWRESPFVAAGAALRLRRRPPPAGHSCSKARRAEAHIP
ncbi:MAG: WD40 repeat domain-containing protein, partial [Myxococcales bacterium]|nr:WD40 repeat domain-containing protein [Myxococcales bacterium]